ncbi:MAG: glycosyltransferase family 39 protein [Acidobacteria bacterium]|nr:glycosyltransferase family 39 protein [Acidobacteriota bacterium]MCW5970639.1 glycosyltransferase family 39 protein [Blastocatellales bacterium]
MNETRGHLLAVGLAAVLAAYTAVLINRASYAVGGSDSSGYASLARSLLQGRVALPISELDQLELPSPFAPLFVPQGYTPYVEDGRPTAIRVSYYPVGFPLHLAVGAAILGWRGPFWVSPVAGAVSLLLLFLVARRLGLSVAFALGSAAILAVNPTFIFMASQPMSDVAALLWALVMVWAGLRSREHNRWALLAGAAFGMALLVRPTNILLLAPLIFSLRLKLKPLFFFALGGLPMAAVFLFYNYAAFGHPLQTGYGAISLQHFITTTGLGLRAGHYLYWLMMTMSPLLLLGWIAVAANRLVEWRNRALLIVWFGAFLAFYLCYNIYDAWWYTRFLLPGYPALILGAMLVARDLLGRLPDRRLRLAVGLGLLSAALGFSVYHDSRFGVLDIGRDQAIHADSCRWADARLPARSLVVANEMSGALKFYTNRSILRWDMLQPRLWSAVRTRVVEKEYRVYALLMDHEVESAQQLVVGEWTEQGRMRNVGLWRIDPMEKAPPGISYGSGFSDIERDGDGVSWRWMSDEGVIQLQNTGRPMRLGIEGVVPLESLSGPAAFKIVLNGKVLDEIPISQQAFLKEWVVTPLQQGNKAASELRIITNRVFVPGDLDPRSSDRRRLGFSLTGLVWKEIP